MTALCQFEGCGRNDDYTQRHTPCGHDHCCGFCGTLACHAFVAASPAAEPLRVWADRESYRAGLLRAAEIAETWPVDYNDPYYGPIKLGIEKAIRAEAEVKP